MLIVLWHNTSATFLRRYTRQNEPARLAQRPSTHLPLLPVNTPRPTEARTTLSMNINRSRRSFVGLSMAGLTGLGIPPRVDAATQHAGNGQAKQVLVIFEQGGISHTDTWDPKPETTPVHRSPFKPINTAVPGMQFTELLSRTAKVADKLSVVRCMRQPKPNVGNSHPLGSQYIFSGCDPTGPVEMPDMGSVVSQLKLKTGSSPMKSPSREWKRRFYISREAVV